MIHVFAWDGIHAAEDLGYDTLENFEAVRHLTRACGNSMWQGGFSIEGCENHLYMAFLV